MKQQERKLAELQAETERQLVAFITKRMERGFAAAGREEAVALHAEISRLLPVVHSQTARAHLESRLAELRAHADSHRFAAA